MMPVSRSLTPAADAELLRRVEALELALAERNRALEVMTQELAQARQKIQQLASCDSLTGLASRRHFFLLAMAEVTRALRSRQPLSVLFVDIDKFRRINDEHGQSTGDKVLKAVAEGLRTHARAPDVAARLAGDEFVLLLPQTPPQAALVLARQLCDALAQRSVGGAHVSLSVGVADLQPHEDCIEDALMRAESALKQARVQGSQQVVLAHANASHLTQQACT